MNNKSLYYYIFILFIKIGNNYFIKIFTGPGKNTKIPDKQ